ncbi:dihydroorotase [Ihubacter sp. rT4E-8]|uniref:dihydroorotase n=1 Tax=Ihubacter sp. rT4E-8 TaxID=3242369 RepID=UPI003CED404A
MTTLLKNGMIFTPLGFEKKDVFVSNGTVFVGSASSFDTNRADRIVDCTDRVIVPGFTDVHVHFREPGFFYKETIASGSLAAAAGGYTCVMTMPNLNPAPSDLASLKVQLDLIEKDAKVKVIPYGAITQKQDGRSALSDMDAMAPYVCAFSDDGKGVQTGALMEEAMVKAKELGKMIVAHCEDESLLYGGYIHDGAYAKAHGHKGICSESEWKQVERDVLLAEKTGAPYHVCHISTKETVDIIRKAKARGVDVTCETGPHYLVLCDEDLQEDGRFKMNPPLRSAADRDALIEGLRDGTIDMIATDHAPHSAEEKAKGLAGSSFGIVGLETCFPVLYTHLVEKGIISLEKLIQVMSVNPRKRFGLAGGAIEDGAPADLTILDLNRQQQVDPNQFQTKGRATPFAGWNLDGKVITTIVNGEIAYEETNA